MSAVSVTEWVDGRSGSVNELQVREFARVFTVVTDNPLDGPAVMIDAAGLPRLYDPYIVDGLEVDVGSLVRSITPEKTDSPYVWRVTVKYSSDVESILAANPLLRPAEVSYSTIHVAVPVMWDVERKAVRNAAGYLFDPPVEREEARLVMRVTRNLPGYDPIKATEFVNAVNSKTFLTLKPFSTKMVRFDGTRVLENGKLYWRVDCEFHVRWLREPAKKKRITPLPANEPPNAYRSWTAWVLNQGYTTATGAPVTDKFGQPTSVPMPLAEDGTQLAFGLEPTFLGFDYLDEKDFNLLGLGLTPDS